ncbi:hypothetical protein ES705_12270 [subsurface metagenome]
MLREHIESLFNFGKTIEKFKTNDKSLLDGDNF